MKNSLLLTLVTAMPFLHPCISNAQQQSNKEYYAPLYEINSYYGFMLVEEGDTLFDSFYMVDKEQMLRYINKKNIDSLDIITDLKDSQWTALYEGGFAYNAYVWSDFVETIKDNRFSLDILEKGTYKNYTIIPVFVVLYDMIDAYEKSFVQLDDDDINCSFFNNKLKSRTRLVLCYIQPLNSKLNEQLNKFHDAYDKQKYLDYLKRLRLFQ